MEKKFDYNDPYDKDELVGWLNGYAYEDWQELIDFTFDEKNKKDFKYDERSNLRTVSNFLSRSSLTIAQHRAANWAYNVVQRIELLKERAEGNKATEGFKVPMSHFTLRVAWHDSNWNGHICSQPDKNVFCNGYHSLLSDRIRRNKEKLLALEMQYAGQPVKKMIEETGMFPPCFWSINIFGDDTLNVRHENPAASTLDAIPEQLPPHSMFSWPFAMSFVRDNEEYKADGKYPANLEKVRVPRFRSKIKDNESIGIVYAKYSNPFTYEDMKYLVIACGKIAEKGNSEVFVPQSEIEKIKSRKRDLRNFPSINWAIRFSFDADSMVRMPYYEYQEEAKRRGYDADETQNLLDKVCVSIDEPELESCFKYVAMDVDDDETIFILTKMRAKLIECQTGGVLEPIWFKKQLNNLEDLLEYCWNRRTHFPGFSNLSRILLDKQPNEDCRLDDFVSKVKESEPEYCEKIKELLQNPRTDRSYLRYENELIELKKKLNQINVSVDDFLLLAMLNLSLRQFQKITDGLINTIDGISDAAKNPYLLFEEYEVDADPQDKITGDFVDHPIELFKIDIALFPNSDYLSQNFLQENWEVTDQRRVRALIIQHLKSLEFTTGDCFDDAESIEKVLSNYPLFYKLKADLSLPKHFLQTRTEEYDRHLSFRLTLRFANDKKYYYLNEIKEAEDQIGDFIKALLNTNEPNELIYENIDSYLAHSCQKLKKKLGNGFDEPLFIEERKFLYTHLFPSRFFVLCGSPGSGKSYETLNIIKYFIEKNETYLLLTPTGKASLRLMYDEDFEDVDIEAMTIDKFITQYKYHPEKRKRFNNIIVDESSMIDLIKLHKLLRCFDADDPYLHRLIFVGDPYQLPPIGYGKPFYDIIQYLKSDDALQDRMIELDVNCRQELQGNAILDFCKVFTNEGELSNEQLNRLSNGEPISKGFIVNYWNSEDELMQLLRQEWIALSDELNCKGEPQQRLNELFKINEDVTVPEDLSFEMERFQVITPYRIFADKVNLHFQKEIRCNSEIDILKLFKHGDKIIRTKNYYLKDDLILSNGSIGVALHWEKDSLLCFPELDEKYLSLKDGGIRESEKDFFELAYGITVHKAQGSGFDHVIVILPKRYGLLCKELFYTALSRSKQSISILLEGEKGEDFEKSLFEFARRRTFTENRKTSLLLESPYRSYGLEPEKNVFVQSRIEQMIYRHLMSFRDKYGETESFDFRYEQFPIIGDTTVRIKTDFTIYTKRGTFYWEHLGKLNKPSYKKTWLNIKKPTYEKNGLIDRLITTDELRGINDDKIISIIQSIVDNKIDNEDRLRTYSNHHYSLR